MDIGEAFIGAGVNAAHVNSLLGPRSGPVGTAWATAIATPTTGHAPFMCVYEVGVPVHPPTLFVNKAQVANDRHGTLTWGAAQAGVAAGVTNYVNHTRWTDDRVLLFDGLPYHADELVVICAVWVNPEADDEELVFANNAAATEQALEVGSGYRPRPEAEGAAPSNPYFRTGD